MSKAFYCMLCILSMLFCGCNKEETLFRGNPPRITLEYPSGVVCATPGQQVTITPKVTNAKGAVYSWIIDGKIAADTPEITLSYPTEQDVDITFRVETPYGEAEASMLLKVRSASASDPETDEDAIFFPAPSLFQTTTDRTTIPGRPVALRPVITVPCERPLHWFVDGVEQPLSDSDFFIFTPLREGTYTVTVKTGEGLEASLKVVCLAEEIPSPAGEGKVWEYVPAPGQFINDYANAGFPSSSITTPQQAAEYAKQRLDNNQFVSLGGFGGYIIIGLDSPLCNSGGDYDFYVQGNAYSSSMGGSNEPGIVWVMQDTNGNGIPDDEWYELGGSETSRKYYSVTYYRPGGDALDTEWKDCDGISGTISYLAAFHKQPYYFPAWAASGSTYTLWGSLLPANAVQNAQTGFWSTNPFAWGYADNTGSDSVSSLGDDRTGQFNRFRISDAILPDGSPVNLRYINFIKIQTGVNVQCGNLGEVSTEVFGVKCR